VGPGPWRTIAHVVAGGAGDVIGGIRGVVRAEAVAAEGIIELGARSRRARHSMTGRALGAAVDGAKFPTGRCLTTVAAHVGAGQGRITEGGGRAWLGLVQRIHSHTGWPGEVPDPGIRVVIVGEGAAATAGMTGIAGQGGGQGQVLRMGAGDAGESRAPGTLRQATRTGMTGEASACIGAGNRWIRQLVADLAKRGRRRGRGSGIGMAVRAIGGEGSGRNRHVAVQLGIRRSRQERHRMRRGMFAVAHGYIEAARLGSRRRRCGWMASRIVGRAWVVALGADGGIGRVCVDVGQGRTHCDAPGFGWMRGAHAVAGDAGLGGCTAPEILAVAELAGDQAPTCRGCAHQLGAPTVDGRSGEPWGALVMTPRGHAGWNAATDSDDRDLMALRTGIDRRDGLPAVNRHPARRMVVPVVLGSAG